MAPDRVPVGEALAGLTVIPLAPGSMAVSGIVLLEVMNQDGRPEWVLRTLGEVGFVPLIGALTVMLDHERKDYLDNWKPDEADE